jgi:signal transduction histidine kinase
VHEGTGERIVRHHGSVERDLLGSEHDPFRHNAWLQRALGRLRRMDRVQPYLLDGMLACVVAGLGAYDLLAAGHEPYQYAPVHAPVPLVVASVAGQAVPLVWRRRIPAAVFTIVLVSSVLQWSLGVTPHSSAGLLIALYAVARYSRADALPWAFAGAVAGQCVAAFHDYPFRQQPWTSMFLLGCAATAAAAPAVVARARSAQLAALADRAAHLEVEREQRGQLATLAERSRVSREMHDIIGHNLAVIIRLADGAAFAAETADASRSTEALHLIADTGRQALSELRRTLAVARADPDQPHSADLSPQPGIAELPALLERTQAAGLRSTFQVAGDPTTVPSGVQLATYRIIQEALTNSLKHVGPAATVEVALTVDGREIGIRVQDSGHGGGSTAPPTDSGGGRGIAGILERAALMGGAARAGATGQGGWSVHAVLPLQAPAAAGERP